MQRLSPMVLLRFGLSGSLSTLTYFVVVNLLVLATGLPDAACSFIAYLLSLAVSYGLQSRFTFRVASDSRSQVVRFLIAAAIGLAIATGLVYVCSELLHWPAVIGTALVCILIPAANFIAFRWWVFTGTQGQEQTGDGEIPRNLRPQADQDQVAKDFDALASNYEVKINKVIAFGGREHQFYIDVKRNTMLRLLGDTYGASDQLTVLDLGCGLGAYHPGLKGRFRALHGIDVSSDSIDIAKVAHPEVQYTSYDGTALPYADASFDAIFTICVMHHVPQLAWPGFVAEMLRKLRPGGTALVFEHNPYNPATQYIVRSCDIDKDAVLLKPFFIRQLFRKAGFADVKTRTILSVPPTGPFLSGLDKALGHLPFGAQYYLKATRPL